MSKFRNLLIALGVVGITAVSAYLCLEGAFFLFVGPSAAQVIANAIRIQRTRQALASAQEIWGARQVSDYEITVSNNGFSPADQLSCRLEDTLEIQHGNVIGASRLDECRETYNSLTIDRMFELAERTLSTVNPLSTELHIEFDPDFGYISMYSIHEYPSGGVFGNSSGHPRSIRFWNLVISDTP